MNLILNANEALGNGGEIRVATQKSNGWAIVSVRDNGCGMTKEFIEKSLFRPFKTTKRQGMGIGLFQSKMIVEAHQGRIEVESEEGRGSTFRVFLPVTGK
jgi:signal transduction histidine kinase